MSEQSAGTMRRWSEAAEAVRATRATSKKASIVAEYLSALDAPSLPVAAVFFSGRPFPERDQRALGLGWRAVSNVVQSVAETDDDAMRHAYDRSSDVGTAVADLLTAAGHDPEGEPLRLVEVAAAFDALAGIAGRDVRARKAEAFAALLRRADPLSARYVTSILGGELRIGLREGLLELSLIHI